MAENKIMMQRLVYTKQKRRALKLLSLQGGKCFLCGKIIHFHEVEDVNLHHFIPARYHTSKGSLFNLTATHVRCNLRKSDRRPTILEWWRYRKLVYRLMEANWAEMHVDVNFLKTWKDSKRIPSFPPKHES